MTMRTKQRIQKIQTSLTPKQAVIQWMLEAHQRDSLERFTATLVDVPLGMMPLTRLGDQVSRATQDAAREMLEPQKHRAIRQAVLDTYFLFHLHLGLNVEAASPSRMLETTLLSERLRGMLASPGLDRDRILNSLSLEMDAAYPVDQQTAAAYEAMRRNEVTCHEVIAQCWLPLWLDRHFEGQGKTKLPLGAYAARDGSKDLFTHPMPLDELEALFPDRAAFDRFIAGEDHTCGFADASDEEYSDTYEAVAGELEELIAKKKMHGAWVTLETVPPHSLREVPLVKGEWLDRWIVELAEWGAMLMNAGYTFDESDGHFDESDGHFLAWPRITKAGNELSDTEKEHVEQLREQAKTNLGAFDGPTRSIEGRDYLRCDAYFKWKDRTVPGEPMRYTDGIQARLFKDWIARRKGRATLGGVRVVPDEDLFDRARYVVIEDRTELDRAREERARMLRSLRVWSVVSHGELETKAACWRSSARGLYADHAAVLAASETLSKRYFEGNSVLFPANVERVETALKLIKSNVIICRATTLVQDTRWNCAAFVDHTGMDTLN